MTDKLQKRDNSFLALNEYFKPIESGDGNEDAAARSILRLCRLSESRQQGGGRAVIQLENETELRAAETLQDRGFGHVELGKTGQKDRFGRSEMGWVFVPTLRGLAFAPYGE
jgi:hypothetical protein